MKRLAITILTIVLMTTPCYATTCHELTMSYILHDQDKPREVGDRLYISENTEICPVLLDTTAYLGERGSHGDKLNDNHVAYMQHSYGWDIELYHADLQEDGTYTIGSYIGRYQVKDCGYGKESGSGKSQLRPEKSSKGTIETGETVDVHRDSYSECKEWMKDTKGMVFAVFIKGKG